MPIKLIAININIQSICNDGSICHRWFGLALIIVIVIQYSTRKISSHAFHLNVECALLNRVICGIPFICFLSHLVHHHNSTQFTFISPAITCSVTLDLCRLSGQTSTMNRFHQFRDIHTYVKIILWCGIERKYASV